MYNASNDGPEYIRTPLCGVLDGKRRAVLLRVRAPDDPGGNGLHDARWQDVHPGYGEWGVAVVE